MCNSSKKHPRREQGFPRDKTPKNQSPWGLDFMGVALFYEMSCDYFVRGEVRCATVLGNMKKNCKIFISNGEVC